MLGSYCQGMYRSAEGNRSQRAAHTASELLDMQSKPHLDCTSFDSNLDISRRCFFVSNALGVGGSPNALVHFCCFMFRFYFALRAIFRLSSFGVLRVLCYSLMLVCVTHVFQKRSTCTSAGWLASLAVATSRPTTVGPLGPQMH